MTLTQERAAAAQPFGTAQPTKAVIGWAVFGGLWMAMVVGVIGHWLLTDDLQATPHGATRPPDWQIFMAHFWEVVVLAGLGWTAWRLILRPWRRGHRIPLDGMLMIAFMTAWFQDVPLNYSQNWFTYNTAFTNWGSWAGSIPGWIAPRSGLVPEPVLFALGGYPFVIFGATIVMCGALQRCQARWPHLRKSHLIGITFISMVVFDLVLEVVWLRMGLYAYPGAIEWLTLFHGHYYQFPIYEALVFGGTLTAWTSLRFFRDDKGRTIAERGVDEVRASARGRSGLRLLAVIGAVNAIFLLTYNIPINFFGLHSSPWPEDIQKRSYLTDGLCGPGTEYACPGPGTPIFRPDSLHITPDGQLRVTGSGVAPQER